MEILVNLVNGLISFATIPFVFIIIMLIGIFFYVKSMSGR